MSTPLASASRRTLVTMIVALIALVGCSSSTTTDPDPTPEGDVYMRATVNGAAWSCSPDAVVATGSPITTTLTGTYGSPASGNYHTIIVSFPAANYKLGEYRIDSLGLDVNAGAVQYTEGTKLGFIAASQDDGFVRITSVTATHVAGEFAFKLIGSNSETGEIVTRTFSGGTFRVPRVN